MKKALAVLLTLSLLLMAVPGFLSPFFIKLL